MDMNRDREGARARARARSARDGFNVKSQVKSSEVRAGGQATDHRITSARGRGSSRSRLTAFWLDIIFLIIMFFFFAPYQPYI